MALQSGVNLKSAVAAQAADQNDRERRIRMDFACSTEDGDCDICHEEAGTRHVTLGEEDKQDLFVCTPCYEACFRPW
jgi:predicted CXXCH cytochrome family protein